MCVRVILKRSLCCSSYAHAHALAGYVRIKPQQQVISNIIEMNLHFKLNLITDILFQFLLPVNIFLGVFFTSLPLAPFRLAFGFG